MTDNNIQERIKRDKELFIEQLKKTPIISVVCQKTEIGRTTFYRWKKEDEEFKKMVDGALMEGIEMVNDLAESQLINHIKGGTITAIFYWLNNRHPSYRRNYYDLKAEDVEKINTVFSSLVSNPNPQHALKDITHLLFFKNIPIGILNFLNSIVKTVFNQQRDARENKKINIIHQAIKKSH